MLLLVVMLVLVLALMLMIMLLLMLVDESEICVPYRGRSSLIKAE